VRSGGHVACCLVSCTSSLVTTTCPPSPLLLVSSVLCLCADLVECVNPLDYPDKRIQDVIIEKTTEKGWGGVDYSFECSEWGRRQRWRWWWWREWWSCQWPHLPTLPLLPCRARPLARPLLAVGRTETMRAALEATHRGWGVSCIIGVAPGGQDISTRPFQLVTGRTWKGTAFGGVRGRTELPGLITKLLPSIDPFITHTYKGVESLNDAFHVMHEPKLNCIRPVIDL